MFKFRHLSHYKSLWKLCRVKQSSLRSSFSLFSISVVGGFYHHDSYADASFLREDQTNTFVVQSKVDHKSDLRKLEAKVNSLFRLVRWLEESISHLATLFFRSIYLLMAFSPATTTFPLLLIGSDEIEKWWWNILRDCVRRSGPCSTKFAQWIATRPDLFPLSLCKNLEDLQSKAFQHKWKDTEKALVLAFGEKWADLIHLEQNQTINGAPFSPVVLGSGCVAQVLLGKLGDRRVAVKIIHPGVREAIQADVKILYFLSSLVSLVPGTDNFSLTECVEEFSTLMMQQLDMNLEAENLDKFRKNFQIINDKESNVSKNTSFLDRFIALLNMEGKSLTRKLKVTFPEPIHPFISTSVLVESYEPGRVISEILAEITNKKMRKDIAVEGLDAILKMVFEDNFIHADLHPGNVIYSEYSKDSNSTPASGNKSSLLKSASSDNEWVLSFIDTGLVANLSKEDRTNFIELFAAVIKNDGTRVGQLMIERSRGGGANCINPKEFAEEIGELVHSVHRTGLSLGRIGIGALMQKVLVLCYIHKVKLEPKFVSVMIAMGVVEGLGKRLDPDVDVLMRAAPYVLKAALFN